MNANSANSATWQPPFARILEGKGGTCFVQYGKEINKKPKFDHLKKGAVFLVVHLFAAILRNILHLTDSVRCNTFLIFKGRPNRENRLVKVIKTLNYYSFPCLKWWLGGWVGIFPRRGRGGEFQAGLPTGLIQGGHKLTWNLTLGAKSQKMSPQRFHVDVACILGNATTTFFLALLHVKQGKRDQWNIKKHLHTNTKSNDKLPNHWPQSVLALWTVNTTKQWSTTALYE